MVVVVRHWMLAREAEALFQPMPRMLLRGNKWRRSLGKAWRLRLLHTRRPMVRGARFALTAGLCKSSWTLKLGLSRALGFCCRANPRGMQPMIMPRLKRSLGHAQLKMCL
jgi:hypothetical protein